MIISVGARARARPGECFFSGFRSYENVLYFFFLLVEPSRSIADRGRNVPSSWPQRRESLRKSRWKRTYCGSYRSGPFANDRVSSRPVASSSWPCARSDWPAARDRPGVQNHDENTAVPIRLAARYYALSLHGINIKACKDLDGRGGNKCWFVTYLGQSLQKIFSTKSERNSIK